MPLISTSLSYINDIPKIIQDTSILFADDISILTSCQYKYEINEKINNIINKVTNWMNDHSLEINYKKTKLMTFHPYQKDPLTVDYSYNTIKLEVVDSFTLLGVEIDKHVTWKPHVKSIKAKLSKFVYALREIKKTTDFKTALSTYYAYANAWLTYGIILWGNSTDAPAVFTLQKKLIRILVNINQTDSCKPYFIKHRILTLTCLYIIENCKFVRKHPELYTKRENAQFRYTSRQKNNLMAPPSKLKIHSTGPLKMTIKLYNKLPETIKSEPKDNIFVNKLKQILINKAYYSLNEYLDDKIQ